MEQLSLDKDIKTICITAKSFPMGVLAAHKTLHALLPSMDGRQIFGISYGNTEGGIVYKAAVEELFEGEAQKHDCESFVIKKGAYISETLVDYQKDTTAIGISFQRMLTDPRLDKEGYCLEIYISDKEVQCLVKLQD